MNNEQVIETIGRANELSFAKDEIRRLREQLQAAKALLEKAQADTRRMDWALSEAGQIFFYNWNEFVISVNPPTRADVDEAMKEAAP